MRSRSLAWGRTSASLGLGSRSRVESSRLAPIHLAHSSTRAHEKRLIGVSFGGQSVEFRAKWIQTHTHTHRLWSAEKVTARVEDVEAIRLVVGSVAAPEPVPPKSSRTLSSSIFRPLDWREKRAVERPHFRLPIGFSCRLLSWSAFAVSLCLCLEAGRKLRLTHTVGARWSSQSRARSASTRARPLGQRRPNV